jgi:hypothetical protein
MIYLLRYERLRTKIKFRTPWYCQMGVENWISSGDFQASIDELMAEAMQKPTGCSSSKV